VKGVKGIDKIRNMSAEEMAGSLIGCPSFYKLNDFCQKSCEACWLIALNAEVESEVEND
jgi:hypothetical protein